MLELGDNRIRVSAAVYCLCNNEAGAIRYLYTIDSCGVIGTLLMHKYSSLPRLCFASKVKFIRGKN